MPETLRKLKKYLKQKFFSCSGRRSSSTITPFRPSNILSDCSFFEGSFSERSFSSTESGSTLLSSSSPFFGNLYKQVSKDACAICLVKMEIGQEAIFTSECSHSFHLNCIVSNVEYGNNLCPICCIKWKSIPFKGPTIAQPLRLPPILATLAETDDDFLACLNRRRHSTTSSSLQSSFRHNPAPEPYIDDDEVDELLLAACQCLSPPTPTPSPS